jgi:hypothetical protein
MQVKFSNVSISIYAGNDIVSNELRGKGRSWEHNEVKEMLWAVRQYWKQDAVMMHLDSRPQQPAAAAAAAKATTGSGRLLLQHQQQQQQQEEGEERQPGVGGGRQLLSAQKGSRPLMVDVGSNVGWFAINAAAAGARVAAFEGVCVFVCWQEGCAATELEQEMGCELASKAPSKQWEGTVLGVSQLWQQQQQQQQQGSVPATSLND